MTFPRRVDTLEIQHAGTDVLVHDTATRKIHVLNETAAKVLSMCDGEHGIDAIVDGLSEDGAVDRERVRTDVEAVLASFEKLGLLQPAVV